MAIVISGNTSPHPCIPCHKKKKSAEYICLLLLVSNVTWQRVYSHVEVCIDVYIYKASSSFLMSRAFNRSDLCATSWKIHEKGRGGKK